MKIRIEIKRWITLTFLMSQTGAFMPLLAQADIDLPRLKSLVRQDISLFAQIVAKRPEIQEELFKDDPSFFTFLAQANQLVMTVPILADPKDLICNGLMSLTGDSRHDIAYVNPGYLEQGIHLCEPFLALPMAEQIPILIHELRHASGEKNEEIASLPELAFDLVLLNLVPLNGYLLDPRSKGLRPRFSEFYKNWTKKIQVPEKQNRVVAFPDQSNESDRLSDISHDTSQVTLPINIDPRIIQKLENGALFSHVRWQPKNQSLIYTCEAMKKERENHSAFLRNESTGILLSNHLTSLPEKSTPVWQEFRQAKIRVSVQEFDVIIICDQIIPGAMYESDFIDAVQNANFEVGSKLIRY